MYLIDHGYTADFIDCTQYNEDLNDVISLIKKDQNPIIGITSSTRDRFYAYNLITKIRTEVPSSTIIVGGRHFGYLPEETLRELPDVDIVVRGEGEITLKEICDSIYKKATYHNILGISYRHGDKIVHNLDRPIERNLDKFRSYDINLLKTLKDNQLLFPGKCDQGNLYFTVMASRGCPGSCVFCAQGAMAVRFRSVDSLLSEIEEKIKFTGLRNVAFADSSFTASKKFIQEFCRKVVEKNMNIRWRCYSRANIEFNLLETMKKAGLDSIEVGLESASPLVLKCIKKNINLDHLENLCKNAYKLKIKVFLFCMISLPDEKIEDVDMTISFIKKVSKYVHSIGTQVTRITPDAAIFEIAKKKNIIPQDFNWFKPYTIPDELHEIAKNPLHYTVPVYLEHLTVRDVANKLKEFKKVSESDFVYLDTIIRLIRNQLSIEKLRELTLKSFIRKSFKGSKKLISACRNYSKHKLLSD